MRHQNFQIIVVASIVSMGGFIFGFDASVISGVVGFVGSEYNLNEWQIGLVVSAPTLGAILSGASAGPLSDHYGRKLILQMIAGLYVVSAMASALAPNFETLVLARFVGGLAFASLGIAPVYISEISPPNLRGRMVSINQLNIVVGFSAAYFANYLLMGASSNPTDWVHLLGIDQYTWRWMLGIEVIPAMIYFLLLFSIPESPRWLAMKGRHQAAQEIFTTRLKQPSEQTQFTESISGHQPQPVWERFGELFSPRLKIILAVGIIISVAQQITGINAIYFYAPSIFEQSGVGTDAAFAQAVLVGITNVIFTLVAMSLIDVLGRKPLLMMGLAGVTLSMLICSYGFHSASYQLNDRAIDTLKTEYHAEDLNAEKLRPLSGKIYRDDVSFKQALRDTLGTEQTRDHQSALIEAAISINSTLILIGILGFVASFAVSLGPVMWVLLPEIFPNRLRGVAMAFTGIINSGTSFLIQLVFPWELAFWGAATTFALYAVFSVISILLLAYFLPETRGKSLEDIEQRMTKSIA